MRVSAPDRDELAWVAATLGPGTRVVGTRRLVGGVTSAVHQVTVEDRRGRRDRVVLRRWTGGEPPTAGFVSAEVAVLERLSATGLPVPRLLGAAPSAPRPALLMTQVPGHVHLSPSDPDGWLRAMAAVLPRIHAVEPGGAAPYESWLDAERLAVPEWSTHKAAWKRAIAVFRDGLPDVPHVFVHHDFQHFNVLWRRERLTGVVDWVFAGQGPPEVDVGHCRLNLAVLFSADWAERFRLAYEAEAGRTVDPAGDAAALLVYLPGWGSFIQVQAGRRAVLDKAGMHRRVDDLMALVARRL